MSAGSKLAMEAPLGGVDGRFTVAASVAKPFTEPYIFSAENEALWTYEIMTGAWRYRFKNAVEALNPG
jgi:hypothetical protein